jgi:hypothetical protein
MIPASWLKPRAIVALSTLAAVCGSASAAEIYKWLDERGVTHYSNIRPAGVNWERLPQSPVSIIPSGPVPELAGARDRETAAVEDPAAAALRVRAEQEARLYQERRALMLDECEANNGADCAREVDVELRAQRIQERGNVIHSAPPAGPIPPTVIQPPAPAAIPGNALTR